MKLVTLGCAVCLVVLTWVTAAPLTRAATSTCKRVFGPGVQDSACVSRSASISLARATLFSEVDPTSVIKRDTRQSLAGIAVVRSPAQFVVPPGAAPWSTAAGPTVSFFYRYGRVPGPQRVVQPPGARATYVDVREGVERESRGIKLLREPGGGPSGRKRTGIWFFSADLDRHHVSLEVDSDGPRAIVSRIGWELVRALRSAAVPPSAPVRIYVLPPHGALHARYPATFLVATNGHFITAHVGIDYSFRLGGAWARPHVIEPGNTQACGGDTEAGEPYRKSGLWKFAWGDCEELKLVLTPTRAGPHSLTIYCYRVPLNRKGVPNYRREQLEPRETYVWHGRVRA